MPDKPISILGFSGVDNTTDPLLLGRGQATQNRSALAFNYRSRNGVRAARFGYRPVLDFASYDSSAEVYPYPVKSGVYFPYGSKAVLPLTSTSYEDSFYLASGSADQTEFSIEFWYRASNTHYDRDILKIPADYTTDSAFNTAHFHLYFWKFGIGVEGATYIRLDFLCYQSDEVKTAMFYDIINPMPMDGEWHHVAITRNGSDGTAVKLYLDGAYLSTMTNPGDGVNNLPIVKDDLLKENTDSPLLYNHLEIGGGKLSICDFRMWSDERTAAEIAANYLEELAGTEAGLAVYCPLNEGDGKHFTDSVSGARGYFAPQEPYVNDDYELVFTGYKCMAYPSLRAKWDIDSNLSKQDELKDGCKDGGYEGGILWDTALSMNDTATTKDMEEDGVLVGMAQMRIKLRQLKEGILCGRLGICRGVYGSTPTENFKLFFIDESRGVVWCSNAVIDDSWIGVEKTISVTYSGDNSGSSGEVYIFVDDTDETDSGTTPAWASGDEITDSNYLPFQDTQGEDSTNGAIGGAPLKTDMCIAFDLVFFRHWWDTPHEGYADLIAATYDQEDVPEEYRVTAEGLDGYIDSAEQLAHFNSEDEIFDPATGITAQSVGYLKMPFNQNEVVEYVNSNDVSLRTGPLGDAPNTKTIKSDVLVRPVLDWEISDGNAVRLLRTDNSPEIVFSILQNRMNFSGAVISSLVNSFDYKSFKNNEVTRPVYVEATSASPSYSTKEMLIFGAIEDDTPINGIERVGGVIYKSRYLILGTDDRDASIYKMRSLRPRWCAAPLKFVPIALPPIRGICRYTSEDEKVDKLLVVAWNAVWTLDADTGAIAKNEWGLLDRNSDEPVNFVAINNRLVIADEKQAIKINAKGNFSRLGVERPVDVRVVGFNSTGPGVTGVTFGNNEQYAHSVQFYDSENDAYSGSIPIFTDHDQGIKMGAASDVDAMVLSIRSAKDYNIDRFVVWRNLEYGTGSGLGTSTELFKVRDNKLSTYQYNYSVTRDIWQDDDIDDNVLLPAEQVGQDLVPVPGKGIGVGFKRLFIFGPDEAKSTLSWSDVDALGLARPDMFPATNAKIIEEGGTTQGTAVIEFSGQLYIFKDNAIFQVYQDAQAGFGTRLGYNGVGAINQRCVVLAGNAVIHLDRSGIYRYQGGEPTLISPELSAFFKDRVNQDEIDRAFLLYHKVENILLAFVPDTGSTYCDLCVVFDFRNNTVTLDMIPPVTCGYVDDTDIYLGTPYGQVLKYSSSEYIDFVEGEYTGSIVL